jgi:hypothetical protein
MNAMYIYRSETNGNIVYASTYSHIASCDPVVAQGDYAYVTLSTNGTRCWCGVNQMDVIKISNP